MRPERWREVDEMLQAALECPETERRAFLDTACASDATLRREVENYLTAYLRAGGFLDTPAIEWVATLWASVEDTNPTLILTGSPGGAAVKKNLFEPGSILDDRYLIEKELAKGGIGVVYLARDRKLRNHVVVKTLIERAHADSERIWIEEKFRQEIEVMAQINHPGVVSAIDVGALPERGVYLVMQYIPGPSLREAIAAAGMDLARVGDLMRQLSQALAAVHERNIIHRDLKPENILLQQAGGAEYAKIIDFGIAKVRAEISSPAGEQKTVVAGTPAYIAPEQLQGRPSTASDIYALGVIAYEMLTGQRPITTNNVIDLARMQREREFSRPRHLRPEIPAAADAVILKALAFDQHERYNNAREFGDDLSRALMSEGKGSEPESELAHALFSELVGISGMTADERAWMLRRLQEVVSATASFQDAQSSRRLLGLPTGEGMALVFFDDALAPVRCAVEISLALKSRPELDLRMGIHTGPVRRFADINQNLSIADGGLNLAKRVMNCGEAGHILLSKTVAGALGQRSEAAGHLQDWGEQTVNHGVKVHVFNYYTGEAGNSRMPARLRGASSPGRLAKRVALPLLAALLGAAGVGAYHFATKDVPTEKDRVESVPISERKLSYSLMVQPNLRLHPDSRPFDSDGGEITFGNGDQVRLNVSSPQSGYLYVINEGPAKSSGPPDMNVLFPYKNINGGSASINANKSIQIPSPSSKPELDWFIFDKERGVEKIWLIWSERSVAVLEDVKGWANPKDRGEIGNPRQIESVKRYLEEQSTIKPEVEKGGDNHQMILKARGGALAYLVKLEHR